MGEMTLLVLVLCCAIVCIPPFLLLRPLAVAIANRIAGKRNDSQDVKELKNRVEMLEKELSTLQHRVIHVEEKAEFQAKLIDGPGKGENKP